MPDDKPQSGADQALSEPSKAADEFFDHISGGGGHHHHSHRDDDKGDKSGDDDKDKKEC